MNVSVVFTRGVLSVCAVLALALAACDGGGTGTCSTDTDCDATGEGYVKCDIPNGICVCADDRGCGAQEFCNPRGRCQALSGCATNEDCGADNGLFCDITSSQCLSVQECGPDRDCCTLDSQCGFGSICDSVTLSCVPGCRENGDCLIGQGCTGAGFGRIGICGGACTDDTLCKPGELCNLETGACELDVRGPYCLSCSGGVGSDDCGDFANYCLVDTSIAADPNNPVEYCGVDCGHGQACPNGYGCSDVIIVPASAPLCRGPESCVIPGGQTTGTCSRTAASCAVDGDCPQGPPQSECAELRGGRAGNCEADPLTDCRFDGDCATGACIVSECRGGEGDALGACSCTRDADCPADTCKDADLSDPDNPVYGHCELTGARCLGPIDCDVITCVEGGCLIGRNCAPSNNRSCADLRPE